jgi:PTH1 family peptidyl-tRNA hydrolase
MRPLKLIPKVLIGLGNPGKQYVQARHNLGYLVLDKLSEKHQTIEFRKHSKISGSISQFILKDKDVTLFKSSKFMNESGISINQFIQYYKIKIEEVCIIHDDLDLNIGEVKVKFGGGHGGHNGLRSIIQHCSPDFSRIRIGIGHPKKKEVIDYVLSTPNKVEKKILDSAILNAVEGVETIIHQGIDEAMNQFN